MSTTVALFIAVGMVVGVLLLMLVLSPDGPSDQSDDSS